MAVALQIPPRLARYAGGQRSFELSADSLAGLLDRLCQIHADVRSRLLDGQGRLYPYLAVIHNQQQLNSDELIQLSLCDGDRVEIVTLASGG